ncbi:hypothetical protein GCM10028805_54420 [Spirosoma harenae]
MSNQVEKTPQAKKHRPVICVPSPDLPYYTYQEEYSYLERLSESLAKNPRFPLELEAVNNLLDTLCPYKTGSFDLPDEITKARIWAIKVATLFIEQLIISNPLLLPNGYEISNEDNCLSLVQAPYGGVMSLRTDSMAPFLPKETGIAYWGLKPEEWKKTKRIVWVYRYSDYDAETVGRIVEVTEETFTLRRENPDYTDLVIPWSDVVRMLSFGFVVGEKLFGDYE